MGIIRRQELEMVDKDTSVAEAMKLMVNRNVGSLIVKRSNPKEAYGIVTRRDIIFQVVAEGLDPNAVQVSDIMSSPLVVLNNIHLDVQYAAKAMANSDVTKIVMFDSGDIYGFLSSSDIISALASEEIRKSLDSNSNDVSGAC
jgi:predicted transcriptional regulator